MKIFDASQIKTADEITIIRQGITSSDLMDRAAKEMFLWLKKKFPDKETFFHVFCGHGNNGGDGLVVARLLHEDGYTVFIDIIEATGTPTPDFSLNLQKIKESGLEYNSEKQYKGTGKTIFIDAIFGTGLTRELNDEVKEVIAKINTGSACIVSIDVPSGMFMHMKTDVAVQSDIVLTLHFPKLPFYLSGNHKFTKDIVILDIGIDINYIETTDTQYFYTDKLDIYKRYKPVAAHAHKGTQGHALIIGGSYGKIGAACLSAKAALKSGCGLVTAYIPKCGYTILQTAFPEAMVITDGEEYITSINFDIKPKAIGIGMGIGQHPDTQKALFEFLQLQSLPLVLDADALNILSYNKEWLRLLPQNSILTPHPKELERLMGSWHDDFDKIEKMKAFSNEYNIVLVAKDSDTMIIYNDTVYINSTGNAALATGGSGDVLTGIITGLLAQSYNPVDAAIFGVYLHGLTANIGSKQVGKQAFTASDVLKFIGPAYLKIEADFLQT